MTDWPYHITIQGKTGIWVHHITTPFEADARQSLAELARVQPARLHKGDVLVEENSPAHHARAVQR